MLHMFWIKFDSVLWDLSILPVIPVIFGDYQDAIVWYVVIMLDDKDEVWIRGISGEGQAANLKGMSFIGDSDGIVGKEDTLEATME